MYDPDVYEAEVHAKYNQTIEENLTRLGDKKLRVTLERRRGRVVRVNVMPYDKATEQPGEGASQET